MSEETLILENQNLYVSCLDSNDQTVDFMQDFSDAKNIGDIASLFEGIARYLREAEIDGDAAYKRWVDYEEKGRGCI